MIKAASLALQPLSYLFIFSLFFILLLPPALIALPFPQHVRARMNAPAWQLFSWLVVRVAVGANVYLRDERPREEVKSRPEGLYIANHQSFVDVPLVLSLLPIPPIMKKEVLYIPVLGICGYSAGAMIVDRKDKNSRKKVFDQAKERLTAGIKALMFYPEGTRNRSTGKPKDWDQIKKPILNFAYEQNIPVTSISVYGTRSVLSPSSLKLNYGQKIGMIARKSKKPADYPDADSFVKDCWEDVQNGYRELEEKLS